MMDTSAALRLSALICASAVAACDTGPVSAERADAICSDRARAAAAPQGRIGIGGGTGGLTGGISISVSADYLAGRDPQEVYDTCFADLTTRGTDAGAPATRTRIAAVGGSL